MQDLHYIGPESVTWKIASEAIINLGGSRAVLMQLAHPLVAIGVSEHSRYMDDPFGRAAKTFMLGQMLTFGPKKTVQQAAHIINRSHKCVYGTLTDQIGPYPAGTTYKAYDPELLLWVHATLVDTVLLLYPLFIQPLSHNEQEQYYQESKRVVRLLGLSTNNMPATIDDLRHYIHNMVHSNRLVATPQARQLARQLLFPPTTFILHPFMYLNLYITCAILPQQIRGMYDLEWGPRRQQLFMLAMRGIRMLLAHLPTFLRILPITRKIMQQGVAT